MKTLILLVALAVAVSTFTIQQNTEPSVKGLPWPFTVCGKGAWDIQSLTLAQTPARNINDDIDVVNNLLFSLEQPMMTPHSPQLPLM